MGKLMQPLVYMILTLKLTKSSVITSSFSVLVSSSPLSSKVKATARYQAGSSLWTKQWAPPLDTLLHTQITAF